MYFSAVANISVVYQLAYINSRQSVLRAYANQGVRYLHLLETDPGPVADNVENIFIQRERSDSVNRTHGAKFLLHLYRRL